MTDKPLVRTFAESFPVAQAVRLEEMIAVSPDAVVSRTLAKSEAGTLTLFAFDAGQELSEHTAPFDAFVQVLDGGLELTIGGERVEVGAGACALMPAGVPHAVRAPAPARWVLFMLRR
jgi:quercetin dioxygenase-like cupin family protein